MYKRQRLTCPNCGPSCLLCENANRPGIHLLLMQRTGTIARFSRHCCGSEQYAPDSNRKAGTPSRMTRGRGERAGGAGEELQADARQDKAKKKATVERRIII